LVEEKAISICNFAIKFSQQQFDQPALPFRSGLAQFG